MYRKGLIKNSNGEGGSAVHDVDAGVGADVGGFEDMICPSGHQRLARFLTALSGYRCDVCHVEMVGGVEMYGCRLCPDDGYDVCVACMVAAAAAAGVDASTPMLASATASEGVTATHAQQTTAAAAKDVADKKAVACQPSFWQPAKQGVCWPERSILQHASRAKKC
jgi:hypothetical protein